MPNKKQPPHPNAVQSDEEVDRYFRPFRDDTADFLVEDTKAFIRRYPHVQMCLGAYSVAAGLPTYTVEITDCHTNELLARFYDHDAD